MGYFIHNGQIYNLKSLLYTAIPQQYAHASGVVELFKAKIVWFFPPRLKCVYVKCEIMEGCSWVCMHDSICFAPSSRCGMPTHRVRVLFFFCS